MIKGFSMITVLIKSVQSVDRFYFLLTLTITIYLKIFNNWRIMCIKMQKYTLFWGFMGGIDL